MKKVFLTLVMFLLAFTGVVRADELTVHDGTGTNSYVPAYGFYADAYLKCEMVYPAAELTDMVGGTINGITYYATTPASDAWTGTWQVFVREVTDATISAFVGPGTVVYEGLLDGTQSEMEITFTTPYQYNGGNLLVGVYETATGNYKSVTWAGETVDGASVQGYSYSDLSSVSATQRNFLPKTTFEYEAAGPSNPFITETVEIGDGTGTTYMVPFNSLYGYSFTEQVFLASEIGLAGDINTISFNLGQSYTAAQTNQYTVWMKNVERETFASNSDIEPVTAADVVFEGTWEIPANTTGWITLTLDTPFAYDGTSNLMFAMLESTSGYSTRYFTYTSVTNSGISYYSDSYVPDPYDLSSYSGSKVLRSNRNNILLEISYESTVSPGFHVNPDPIELGDRAIGVWSEPQVVNLTYGGGSVTVNGFEVDNEFFAINAEVPFTLGEDPVEIESVSILKLLFQKAPKMATWSFSTPPMTEALSSSRSQLLLMLLPLAMCSRILSL